MTQIWIHRGIRAIKVVVFFKFRIMLLNNAGQLESNAKKCFFLFRKYAEDTVHAKWEHWGFQRIGFDKTYIQWVWWLTGEYN